jgi:hypothetical protein
MRLSRNFSRTLLCTLVSVAFGQHEADSWRPADACWRLEAFLGGPLGGIFKTYGRGCACYRNGRRTEGGRKVDGRWPADAGLHVEFKTFPSPCPAAVQRVLSGFSAGFQKVLRRCLICRLARKWLDLDPLPASAGGATHVRCPYCADIDSGRARDVSPIPNLEVLP